MGNRLAEWLTHHRYWLALASLVLVVLLGSGLHRASFETGYRIFFKDDNPYLVAHDLIEDTYTKSDNIAFIVAAREGMLFERRHLVAIEQMTREGWTFPFSLRVDSLTNYQHTYADEHGLVVENLFADVSTMNDAAIARRQDIALSDPILVNNIINPAGSVTLVNITLQFPEGDKADTGQRDRELVNLAREMRDRYQAQHPDLKFHVFGQITINNTFNELTEHDLTVLTPIMSLILFLALWILFWIAGSTLASALMAAFAVMLVVVLSTAAAMGAAGWMGFAFNAANAVAPTIILTIAVADCVHILFNYLNEIRTGKDKLSAIRESLDLNMQPVFLTSLTTAIGFLALKFSDTPPMHSLGILTAIGIGTAYLLAIALLPALATLMPLRPRPSARQRSAIMERLAGGVLYHRRMLFWAVLGFSAFALLGITRNTLNDSTFTYFDETVPFYVASHFYEDNLSGFDTISFSLDSGKTYGINDPAFLHKVDRFVRWLEEQESVAHVNAYTRVIKRLNRNMHGDDPAWHSLPDDRELAAQYLLLYEMSLPFGLDLNTLVNTDKSALRVDIRIRKRKPHEVVAMEAEFSDWLATNLPEVRASPGSSVSIMFAHMGERNIRSMLTGNIVAVMLITLILIIALRSWRYGLISMLPNALPALVTVGLWGYVDGEVNLAVALIFVISLGIVVDDTVHFISKYLRARRRYALSPEAAVRYAFANVGNALVITSLVLVAGFMVLAQSHFQVNAVMGLLVAITIVVALLFDLLFLPPLLEKIDNRAPAAAAEADVVHSEEVQRNPG